MAIIGRGGRVLYSAVWIDDQCDACGERDKEGLLFGPDRPVLCFECIEGAHNMTTMWEGFKRNPTCSKEPPSNPSSRVRRG